MLRVAGLLTRASTLFLTLAPPPSPSQPLFLTLAPLFSPSHTLLSPSQPLFLILATPSLIIAPPSLTLAPPSPKLSTLHPHPNPDFAAVTVSNGRLAGSRSTAALLGWPVGFIVADAFLLLSVAALALAQASQVARNVTTNELANWHRYRYLRAGDGEFHNPFDHGWRANCADTCLDARREPAVYVLDHADAESAPLMPPRAGSGGKLNAMD